MVKATTKGTAADDHHEEEEKAHKKDKDIMVWLDKTDDKEYRLSFEHAKLLYIISFYARAAKNEDQDESWIRQPALNVLIYEGIVAGKLDFDYAPVSRNVIYMGSESLGTRRQFLNLSQEGLSAIEDLREQEFLNRLKISTEDNATTTALQVTRKGLDLLQNLPPLLRVEVEELLFTRRRFKDPIHPKRDLKHVIADEEGFLLVTLNGHEERSGICDVEDISYVITPYIPWVLRKGESMMTDNASRAWESGVGISQVKTELNEATILSQVNVLVAEWVPIAANEFSFLLDRFAVQTRFAGGSFTCKIDTEPNSQTFVTAPGLTGVRFLDYSSSECVNFEAELMYSEDEGIRQVEDLGVHFGSSGSVLYGLRVEAIGKRLADDISLDLLSRMLVDIMQDSTVMLNDVLTANQRRLLDNVYRGDADNRSKFNLIYAEKADPVLKAEMYFDHGEYENELKQVLGDIWGSYDIGEKGDVLVIGSSGLLVIGLRLRKFDRLTIAYSQFANLLTFSSLSFSRLLLIMQDVTRLKDLCEDGEVDPAHFDTVRHLRNSVSMELVMLEELMAYVSSSIQDLAIPPIPVEESGKQLYAALDLPQRLSTLTEQTKDVQKLLRGTTESVSGLKAQIKVLRVRREVQTALEIRHDTSRMAEMSSAESSMHVAYDRVHLALAGLFALVVLDAFISARANAFTDILHPPVSNNSDGSTSFVPDFSETSTDVGDPLSGNSSYFPMVWAGGLDNTPLFNFVAHVVFMALFMWVLRRLERMRQGGGIRTVNLKLDRRVNVKALHSWLAQQRCSVATETDAQECTKRITFTAQGGLWKWRGHAPKVIMKVEVTRGFLHWVTFTRGESSSLLRWLFCIVLLRRREHMSMRANLDDHIIDTFLDTLEDAGIFSEATEVEEEAREDVGGSFEDNLWGGFPPKGKKSELDVLGDEDLPDRTMEFNDPVSDEDSVIRPSARRDTDDRFSLNGTPPPSKDAINLFRDSSEVSMSKKLQKQSSAASVDSYASTESAGTTPFRRGVSSTRGSPAPRVGSPQAGGRPRRSPNPSLI